MIYVDRTFVQVRNLTGNFNFTYIVQDGTMVAQLNPDSSKLYFAADHKTNVMVTMNQTGGVLETNFYTGFGEIISGGNKSRYDYEGKETNALTGEIDFNFRHYNPDTVRFTQPDTLISNKFNPQDLNRYTFEKNNPYRYIDPTGHIPKTSENWGRLFMAGIQTFSSLSSALGVLGLSLTGTVVTGGAGGASLIVAIPIAVIGFASAGDGVVDIVNAWNNNDEYFETDGGIGANVGRELGGEMGQNIGGFIDLTTSIYGVSRDMPQIGISQPSKYYTSVAGIMDASYTALSYIDNSVEIDQAKDTPNTNPRRNSGGSCSCAVFSDPTTYNLRPNPLLGKNDPYCRSHSGHWC